MELDCEDFVAVNVPTTFEQPDDVHEYFSLQAPPNTSIWRKPSASDDTTAPMILKRLRNSFLLAEVTVSAALTEEFDQAGIVIFAGSLPDPTLSPLPIAARRVSRHLRRGSDAGATGRWAKAGLQLVEREPHVASVVAISPCGADWTSSARLPVPSTPCGLYPPGPQSLRMKLERMDESLWIWYRFRDGVTSVESQNPNSSRHSERRNPEDVASEWTKVREIMGFFAGHMNYPKEIWVGCYASRPMEFEPRHSWESPVGLLAEFEDLEIV